MERKIRRVLVSGLILAILFSSQALLASCGKKGPAEGQPIKEITADMPWYDTKTVSLDGDFDKRNYYTFFSEIGGVLDGIVYVNICGYRVLDQHDEESWGRGADNILRCYDLEGNLIDEIDLLDKLDDFCVERLNAGEEDIGGLYTDEGITLRDGKIIVHGFASGCSGDIDYIFDPVQKKFVSLEMTYDNSPSQRLTDYYASFEGYTVRPEIIYGTGITLDIESPDGNISAVDVASELPELGIVNGMQNYIYTGDGKVVVTVFNESYQYVRFMLDLRSGTVSSLADDRSFDWLDDHNIPSIRYYDGIGNVFTDADGVYVLNMDTHEQEKIVSFDDCNVNRYDIWNLPLIYMDEDSMVFGGGVFRGAADYYFVSDMEKELVILRRCDTNPNAGKTVLNAAVADGNITYTVAEAVRLFNERSEDAIIMFDPRYDGDDIFGQIDNPDDMSNEEYERRASAAIITALSIDLMAGEGPDIIFGGVENTGFDSPDLLMDLSSQIRRDECFDNIIDDAMTGDVLYQLPLSFSLEGILAPERYRPSGGCGFTFDEYREFVSGACNGSEPTGMDRLDFMNKCLQHMSDLFITDGTYSYDNEAFRNTAAFVSANFPEEVNGENEYAFLGNERDLPQCQYIRIRTADTLLECTRSPMDGYCLLGLPSQDGRGPMVNVIDSVAVSAATSAPDECLEFVRMLTTDEFQAVFAANSGLPINRAAFEQETSRIVGEANYKFENYYSLYYTENEMYYNCRICPELLDEGAYISKMEEFIDSVSGIGFMDAPVQIIVSEEIQAYFAGQKSLDEVIGIIDDRVATYVNERAN